MTIYIYIYTLVGYFLERKVAKKHFKVPQLVLQVHIPKETSQLMERIFTALTRDCFKVTQRQVCYMHSLVTYQRFCSNMRTTTFTVLCECIHQWWYPPTIPNHNNNLIICVQSHATHQQTSEAPRGSDASHTNASPLTALFCGPRFLFQRLCHWFHGLQGQSWTIYDNL